MTGFLLVDKPPGPTSHDMVAAARRRLGIRKIGHAGTLDPPASGLVVLGVGPATRLLQYVQRQIKTYEARGVLGVRTTTLDATGEVISATSVDVSVDRLRAALASFVGEIWQVPPAVSAVKVGGERAYRLAARGVQVRLAPRRVRVHELELLGFDGTDFDIRVRCSSGTYIRTLVADVGDRLGCGAHVSVLRRTAIGALDVRDAVSPDELDAGRVLPVERCVDLPVVRVDEETAREASNGRRITVIASELSGVPDVPDGEVLVAGPAGSVGVFEALGGILRPVTVLGTDGRRSAGGAHERLRRR